MDHTRVYGENVKINEESVAAFYNLRAAKNAEKGGAAEVGAVLLGSQDAGVLDEKIRYDRDYIVPLLEANGSSRVFDLGCGVARWAQYLMPHCAFYCGADVCEKMIELAEKNCSQQGTHYRLETMSIPQAVGQSPEFWGGRFDLVLASGVFLYLNDDTLANVIRLLPNHLAQHCTLYFCNPVGIGRRLTLDDFASGALASNYSAIYRTLEEYLEIFSPLQKLGFSIVKSERRPDFGEPHPDTCRHYFIFRR